MASGADVDRLAPPSTPAADSLCGRDAGLTLRGFHGLFGAALPGAHLAF
ncbi:hypothetical protein ACH4LK_33770 [Streptomyces lydicus]